MIIKKCNIPVLPLRSEPSEKAEMVSQILYGETLDVIAFDLFWNKVKLHYDGYEGWANSRYLVDTNIDKNIKKQIINKLWQETVIDNQTVWLPAGAEIEHDRENLNQADKNCLIFDIISTARMFLGIPYLWGGRSSFGIDCSGFIQTVFKINSIKLPRDARQQVHCGESVDFLNMLKPCDLAFFGETGENVSHVGMILDDRNIIHASGIVRIDTIDQMGIFNAELNTHTHKLLVIKRII